MMTAADTTAPARRARPRRRWLALTALAVFFAWALIEPHTLFVVSSTVSSPDVPVALDGTRVVFLADIHAGGFVSAARVKSVIDRVNALKPDLVVLGGDYVGGNTDGAAVFYPQAARLHAPLGVFAVLGNHDAWEGSDQAISGMASDNIRILDNTSTVIAKNGATMRLAGVEDWGTGWPDVSAAATGIKPADFAILVSHNPDTLARQLPETPGVFDLALAAHTHGGQVTLFGLWAPLVPSHYGNRYRTGWHDISGTPSLVTNGVGTVGLPLRFFAPPQIHVLTLRHAAAASVR
jgi:predicted MPP superfamily phosphohydrolase